ncbi:MAG: hypothetical protein JWM74_4277 [Myxococcaceae bacterium]|nr:hypothetical protein [Myxococcaceae bacterium]
MTDAAEVDKTKGHEMPEGRSLEQRARRLLVVGSVVTTLGIAIAGTVERTAGGIVVVVGWALVIYGIHAFGRAGS